MVNTNYLAYFLGTWLYKGGDDAKSDTTMNIVENLFVAHDECWLFGNVLPSSIYEI